MTVALLLSLPLYSYSVALGEFAGNGRIRGTVKVKHSPNNLPVKRRVRLHYRRDGRFIAQTWSDPDTGAYEFDYLNRDYEYTAVAIDYTGTYEAVAADALVPEAMP